MGVCANSDEHRGRCGGGVSGTAVFGTKGGLTGVLADRLDRQTVAKSLRARNTFATTGERLVALAYTDSGEVQGDDIVGKLGQDLKINYAFYGSSGFSSIEAWDATGMFFHRNLQKETSANQAKPSKLLVTWGGARLYDRYREAVWDGVITLAGGVIKRVEPFGGVLDVPEEIIEQTSKGKIEFHTRTSGDFDGVAITFDGPSTIPSYINVSGRIGGYVKVGDALTPNYHNAQPEFELEATVEEAASERGKSISIKGGAELFVTIELVADLPLPVDVDGQIVLSSETKKQQAVYFVGREWNGGKATTSPIFIDWQ